MTLTLDVRIAVSKFERLKNALKSHRMHCLQQIAQSEQITITTYLELEKQMILYFQAGSLQFTCYL